MWQGRAVRYVEIVKNCEAGWWWWWWWSRDEVQGKDGAGFT